MVIIKVQKAILHSQPRLEIDDTEIRFLCGIFTEPLRALVADTYFIDPDLPCPNVQPMPSIIPRVPVFRTGSEVSHRPNTCLIFGTPVQVPPPKLAQLGTLRISVPRARKGDVWIDGMVIGCSNPIDAYKQLRVSGLRVAPSIHVAASDAYGSVESFALTQKQANQETFPGRGEYSYRRDPPRREGTDV